MKKMKKIEAKLILKREKKVDTRGSTKMREIFSFEKEKNC